MLQKDPNDGNTLLRLGVPLRNCTTVTVVSRYATLPVNKMIRPRQCRIFSQHNPNGTDIRPLDRLDKLLRCSKIRIANGSLGRGLFIVEQRAQASNTRSIFFSDRSKPHT